jgi:putative phage-type endonuclease
MTTFAIPQSKIDKRFDSIGGENRLKGIGGSEAGVILGFGYKKTPLDLWKIKTKEVDEPDLSHIPAIATGIYFEDPVAQMIADRNPSWTVRHSNQTLWSKAYPFAFAHLDRTVNDGKSRGIPLEIKTAGYDDHWGAEDTEDIPHYYYPQIQHQLAVTGKPYAYVGVFILTNRELRVYKIMRNDDYITNTLMTHEATFWEHVEDRIPPEPINASDILKLFPDPTGTIEATDTDIELTRRYLEINVLLESLKDEKEGIHDSLSLTFGAHDTLVAGVAILATFNSTKTTQFDMKTFKAEQPEMYEQYVRRGTTRTLSVKKK